MTTPCETRACPNLLPLIISLFTSVGHTENTRSIEGWMVESVRLSNNLKKLTIRSKLLVQKKGHAEVFS